MSERIRKVESVMVNGMQMYRVENRLFLNITDANNYAKRYKEIVCVDDYRTEAANYNALSFGYSEISDIDFLRMLKNGEIRGILL